MRQNDKTIAVFLAIWRNRKDFLKLDLSPHIKSRSTTSNGWYIIDTPFNNHTSRNGTSHKNFPELQRTCTVPIYHLFLYSIQCNALFSRFYHVLNSGSYQFKKKNPQPLRQISSTIFPQISSTIFLFIPPSIIFQVVISFYKLLCSTYYLQLSGILFCHKKIMQSHTSLLHPLNIRQSTVIMAPFFCNLIILPSLVIKNQCILINFKILFVHVNPILNSMYLFKLSGFLSYILDKYFYMLYQKHQIYQENTYYVSIMVFIML